MKNRWNYRNSEFSKVICFKSKIRETKANLMKNQLEAQSSQVWSQIDNLSEKLDSEVIQTTLENFEKSRFSADLTILINYRIEV